jgi:predicted glycoside hydrolase/deacetylase ChbG (UPF0249 family)
MTQKRLTICSDDFGQNQSIDQGILELVEKKRLHAVTVFTESPGWLANGEKLLAHQNQIDIGIHLNLSQAFPHADLKNSLGKLLIQSHIGLLNKQHIKESFRKQITLFKDQAGKLPDFLDGHQHVHAFPIINDALIELIEEFWGNQKTLYVRNSSKLPLNFDAFLLKRLILKFSCYGLGAKLKRIHVRQNEAFTGVYDFDPQANYRQLFKGWAKSAPDKTLMMCHPASGKNEGEDALFAARRNEFNYLSSDEFLSDCAQLGITLGRYSGTQQ